MHDIKFIRENPAKFDEKLKARKVEPKSSEIISLDEKYRKFLTELQDLQTKRNEKSQSIAILKKEGKSVEEVVSEVAVIKQKMTDLEVASQKTAEELKSILECLPNMIADDVPIGADENSNTVYHKFGEPKAFNFKRKEHYELGEALGLMDFNMAAKLSGARFVVLRGALARLERAISQFMLDLHTTEHGYEETNVPVLVTPECMYGTSNYPKFIGDSFQVESGRLVLIPTAEVPLTNQASGVIFEEKDLPLRYTAFTQCFRSEAGSAGKDTRGMLRQHQFEKVELVSIVHPDKSWEELERKRNCAEEVLKRLEIPYQVVILCSGDIGFSSAKTYDIEVWLPGQNKYREISSCSNCLDFQARRMNARFKKAGEKGTQFVHTLNGSGLAIGRTLIAVMENYQQEDGSILIPQALQKYMGDIKAIKAK